MKFRASYPLLLSALFLIVGVAVNTAAQTSEEQYKDEVLVKLNLVAAAAAAKLGHPLKESHDVYFVNLANDTYKDIRYTLLSNTSYVFVGAGDNDCGGLQLKLFDGNGQVVDSSSASEIPVVSMDVGNGGAAYLRVIMRGCRVKSCFAGVAAYTAQ